MVEIVFDEEGRLVRPRGIRLRIPEKYVMGEKEIVETDQERAGRVRLFFEETRNDLRDEPRKPLSDDDPLVAKYRRMSLLD